MAELPWRKYFPQDWKSDPQLSRCSAATRGIWADAVATMMQQQTFKLEGSEDDLARDCRCSSGEIQAAHEELKRTKAADVSMQNGCRIWVCRRLLREHSSKELKKKAANVRWCKHDADAMQHPPHHDHANDHAPSASASASAYTSVSTSERTLPTKENAKTWLADWIKNGATYTFLEMDSAFNALAANGWMWGKNPVVDFRAALERQIQTDRQHNERNKNTARNNPRNNGVVGDTTDLANKTVETLKRREAKANETLSH